MPTERMQEFKGKVVSGLGHASKRMVDGSKALRLYENWTGLKLVPGSLNIELGEDVNIPKHAKEMVREDHEGLAVIYITPALVNNLAGYAVRNKKVEEGIGTHPKNIIEIISDHNLRQKLNLRDGDFVTVKF